MSNEAGKNKVQGSKEGKRGPRKKGKRLKMGGGGGERGKDLNQASKDGSRGVRKESEGLIGKVESERVENGRGRGGGRLREGLVLNEEERERTRNGGIREMFLKRIAPGETGVLQKVRKRGGKSREKNEVQNDP